MVVRATQKGKKETAAIIRLSSLQPLGLNFHIQPHTPLCDARRASSDGWECKSPVTVIECDITKLAFTQADCRPSKQAGRAVYPKIETSHNN